MTIEMASGEPGIGQLYLATHATTRQVIITCIWPQSDKFLHYLKEPEVTTGGGKAPEPSIEAAPKAAPFPLAWVSLPPLWPCLRIAGYNRVPFSQHKSNLGRDDLI